MNAQVRGALQNAEASRALVLGIYLVAFAGTLAITFAAVYLAVENFPNPNSYIIKVVEVYAVPLTIAIVGVAAAKPQGPSDLTASQSVLLFASTLIWNVLIIAAATFFSLSEFGIASVHRLSGNSYLAALDLAKDQLTFLISGILTYVYAAK